MTYHPKIDGHTERVKKVIEDILQMHVMHQPKQWEEYLPLVELSYNNGYQESLKMIPFEAFYGRKCRIMITWDSPVHKITFEPKILEEMEQAMVKIRHNLEIA
jgi:hypothetical protein